MNLSMKWLSDFVKLKVEPRDFSEKMSMSGSKGRRLENRRRRNQKCCCRKNPFGRPAPRCGQSWLSAK